MNTLAQTFAALTLTAAGVVCAAPVHARHFPVDTQTRHARTTRHRVSRANVTAGIRIKHDVHYGPGTRQTFDVYAPAHAHAAPVIMMVHGGGWRRGDKAARGVVQSKVKHWVPRGFLGVSVNYPLVPTATPLQEARNVARALATAQRLAPRWGGDPHAFVLMGHSAGAHLVSLVSADPRLARAQDRLPILGTVALDSSGYNIVTIMQRPHFRVYGRAFGDDKNAWIAASPILQLHGKIAPFLAVCSSLRQQSCTQAKAFAAKARSLGTRITVLPVKLRHSDVNKQLGKPSNYTRAVDEFLASLSPALAAHLP